MRGGLSAADADPGPWFGFAVLLTSSVLSFDSALLPIIISTTMALFPSVYTSKHFFLSHAEPMLMP